MDFKEILITNGTLVYTNKGVSMLPLIKENRDVLIINRANAFNKNDAVLFVRDNGQYVLHRIKKIKGDSFFIVGDNCLTGEWVNKENVLGVLVGIKRTDKKIINNTDFRYKVYVFFLPLIRVKIKIHYVLHLIKKCLLKIIGK